MCLVSKQRAKRRLVSNAFGPSRDPIEVSRRARRKSGLGGEKQRRCGLQPFDLGVQHCGGTNWQSISDLTGCRLFQSKDKFGEFQPASIIALQELLKVRCLPANGSRCRIYPIGIYQNIIGRQTKDKMTLIS
ncbi:MAG: hypothetical protein OXD42_09105 [Rhodospirillaceae bacterium]|nr:hypothetical protein [Rhodospirillaceae bacterium]